MQYMLLIYGDEAAWDAATPEQKEAEYSLHRQFAGRVDELGGKVLGGAELKPGHTATPIRGDLISDGPFIDTKESLGGYYLIEADDLDQIIAIARNCPSSGGAVEIRPLNE